MKILSTIIALSLASVAHAAVLTTGPCFVFSSSLSQGMTSPAVQQLQVRLNQDPASRIAATGAGSPGNETQYFGALTFAAVERFQEKYALDVLFPLHLYAPTGYVGPATELELNALGCY
jgi:peptidoglycan hydrolase-like protein with peptidoglycan-binding domain